MSFLSQPISPLALLFGPNRSIDDISGYVTVNESTTDDMEITQQPVQQGATISDHAFKKPVSLSVQILFADNLTTSLSDIYDELRALQEPALPDVLTPFTVITPKRVYDNMLLKTLGQTTDKKTENCLAINATFLEIIIVPVSVTLVPRSKQKNPAVTGGVQSAGKKSALAVLFK